MVIDVVLSVPLLTYYYTTTKNKYKDLNEFFTRTRCKEFIKVFISRVKLHLHSATYFTGLHKNVEQFFVI